MSFGKMEGSRSGFGHRRTHRLVPLLLVLAGCHPHPSAGPSAETRYLEERVVPEMTQWWLRRDTEILPLQPLLAAHGYDLLCLVPEETFLSQIETPDRPIETYYSSFGTAVPGGHAALVVVKDSVAHAVLLSQQDIVLFSEHRKMCRTAKSLRLKRARFPSTDETAAHLGGEFD